MSGAIGAGDDNALAVRAREGDRNAFAELVRRHQDRVFRFLVRLTGSRDDALDVAQDSFLRAWQALPGWRPEAKFGTWLFQIARNAALDLLRRRGTVEVATDPAALPEQWRHGDDPFVRLDGTQRVRLLERALAELSPEHREILLLREIEEMGYEEIAATLDLTEGTVKSRLARARTALLGRFGHLAGENGHD